MGGPVNLSHPVAGLQVVLSNPESSFTKSMTLAPVGWSGAFEPMRGGRVHPKGLQISKPYSGSP